MDPESRSRYTTAPTCAAFPEGIPDEIFKAGGDHRKNWPGDHGLRFDLDERFPELLDHWSAYWNYMGVPQ